MLVSVVIPTRNAADRLLYTLFSLNLQYAPFDQFEVIVLDNASSDGTVDRVAGFEAHYSMRCHRTRKRIPLHKLLNEGIAKAGGDLIVLLSGSMIVPREFIGTHRHAHSQVTKLVLTGLGVQRIYSVYDPRFSRYQQEECHAWLEHYPQIKRPHSHLEIIPLLEEKQVGSGLPFQIGLPCKDADKRFAIYRKYGSKLTGYRSPWTLFHTEHVSFLRAAIHRMEGFRALPQREMELDMAKRLLKAGYQLQLADKLTLLRQEKPTLARASRSLPKKNRRAQ